MSPSRREDLPVGPGMLPMMNLVTILIPMLLLSAQFVQMAVVDSTTPGIVDSDRIEPTEDLQLSVLVGTDGLSVAAASGRLDGLLPDGGFIPCHDGSCASISAYDLEALTDRLALIKDGYPDERSLILVPDSRVPYELVVQVMDASREDVRDRGPGGQARELFPQVVFAGGEGS